MHKPTPEQDRIYSFIADVTAGNLIIDAKAGCGKTSTIVWSLGLLPKTMPGSFSPPATTFLAFNKSIADELKYRVPRNTLCSTFHSLGLRAYREGNKSVEVDAGKCRPILWKYCDRDYPDQKSVLRLVSIAKGAMSKGERDELRDLAKLYEIEFEDVNEGVEIAQNVLLKSDQDRNKLDYDDMLRFPILFNSRFPKQDYVFVDELQDTNAIQVEIISRLLYPGSRFIGVGDPNQAIYGFRGATSNAMNVIRTRFNAEVLPLSVTFRCPKKVVAFAQRFLSPQLDETPDEV